MAFGMLIAIIAVNVVGTENSYLWKKVHQHLLCCRRYLALHPKGMNKRWPLKWDNVVLGERQHQELR